MNDSNSQSTFTPREIVSELDRYIISQSKAKRAVAIALRNRWRRQRVPEPLRDEIYPKNIIMIGPTGVGKTEIARRLSNLAQAPFVKVEASKFTEVGYVGRDVEAIIRDLTELSVQMVRAEEESKVQARAQEMAEERLLDLLLPQPAAAQSGFELPRDDEEATARAAAQAKAQADSHDSTREKLRTMLREGKLDDRYVELEVKDSMFPMIEVFSSSGIEDIHIKDMLGNLPGMKSKTKSRKMKVPEAFEQLAAEESDKLVDMDNINLEARKRAEESGIVFIDELDKIAGRQSSSQGPDVSREGVQRDLLPLIEGSTVHTKYGPVRTDHVLFIAAGAFHVVKPSDLIPEMQGRFPIRVELNALGKDEFVRILTEPDNALIKQYEALMHTEGLDLKFTDDAIEEIARIAAQVNQSTENIGARRLYTILETLLDDISFRAPEMTEQEVSITGKKVNEELKDILESEDLSRYIL